MVAFRLHMLLSFLVILLRSFNFNFCFTEKRGFVTVTHSELSVWLSEPFVIDFVPDEDFLRGHGEESVGSVTTST